MKRRGLAISNILIWLFLAAFCPSSVLASPGIGGSIAGTVKDSTGAVVVHASVVATNSETGDGTTAGTDARGAYMFPVFTFGRYALEIPQRGFKPYRRNGNPIETDSALTIDVVLASGQITDTV